MEFLYATIEYLQTTFGSAVWVILPFIAFVAMVAQMRLYAKANQPALAAIIPGWNVTTFMKIIGRPTWHAALIIIPFVLMLVTLVLDYQNIFAFAGGEASFSAVSITLPIFAISALVFTLFMILTHIDLCNSFGRSTVFDYFLVVVLNAFYVLNMGMSYDIDYEGPSYGRSLKEGKGAFA